MPGEKARILDGVESVGWNGWCAAATAVELWESVPNLKKNRKICGGMSLTDYARMRFSHKLETCRAAFDKFRGSLDFSVIPILEMAYWGAMCSEARRCEKDGSVLAEEGFCRRLETREARVAVALRSFGASEVLSSEAREFVRDQVMAHFEQASGKTVVRKGLN